MDRSQIAERAVDLAAKEGLDALSISDLASEVGLSKAGLFAHFGSKEELQLAAVEAARRKFLQEVIAPAQHHPAGLARLFATLCGWIDSVERAKDRGGCFFYAASAEFDAKSGPVHDSLVEAAKVWLEWLTRQVKQAVDRGELDAGVDLQQLAFELHAFGQQANWGAQMMRDPDAFRKSRNAIRSRLLAQSTASGRDALAPFPNP